MYLSMCFRAAPSHVHRMMSSPAACGCGVYNDMRGPGFEKDGSGGVDMGCVAVNTVDMLGYFTGSKRSTRNLMLLRR